MRTGWAGRALLLGQHSAPGPSAPAPERRHTSFLALLPYTAFPSSPASAPTTFSVYHPFLLPLLSLLSPVTFLCSHFHILLVLHCWKPQTLPKTLPWVTSCRIYRPALSSGSKHGGRGGRAPNLSFHSNCDMTRGSHHRPGREFLFQISGTSTLSSWYFLRSL